MTKIIDKDRGLKAILSQLDELDGKAVEAGLFEGEHASKGAFNEFGTPTVPSRPFMRTAADEGAGEYGELAAGEVGEMMDARGRRRPSLGNVGAAMEGDIRQSIVDWDTPPNAPATIAKKGFDDPLVETGQMAASVSHRTADGGD